MDKIDNVSLEPCVDSKFVQPYRMRYKQVSEKWLVGARDTFAHFQNGRPMIWDCVKQHDRCVLHVMNNC